jgi:hypothetical protein
MTRRRGGVGKEECMTATQLARQLRRAAVPAVIALAGACARAPNTGVTPQPTVVEFNNESLAQADVFVRAPGETARRIGTVMAGHDHALVIPPEVATKGNVTIYARLLARSAIPTTGSIAIAPGDRLNVRLPIDARALFVLPASSGS